MESINSACDFVMIFDTAPLLLDTLSDLLELVCFTSNIVTVVISDLQVEILMPALFLLVIKS